MPVKSGKINRKEEEEEMENAFIRSFLHSED